MKASNTKAAKPQSQGSVPVKVPLHPDEVMAAARSRVAKLQTVLATLGEDDETSVTIKAALRKAETQAQERPLSEQIKNTQLFVARKQKRVEEARQNTIQAREALAQALTAQEEQEALLTEGEKRLAELQEKEKTMQSPFTVPEPMVAPHVQAEFSRMQEIIDGLQRELANLRGAQPPCSTLVEDDEDMAANLPHKKSKVGPRTPLALTFGAREHQLRSRETGV